MRKSFSTWVETCRWRNPPSGMISRSGDDYGVFRLTCPTGAELQCIVGSGIEEIPWDHVSVVAKTAAGQRCPTWREMCHAKEAFFEDDECVMQLHPPKKDYVNCHPFVLHLWRPHDESLIPRPPIEAV